MKIAFIDEDLSPRTGSRRFNYEVFRRLKDSGHEAIILTSRIDKTKCFKEYLTLPVEVVPRRNSSPEGSTRPPLQNRTRNPFVEIANDLGYNLSRARSAIEIGERIADAGCDVALFQYHGEHWLLPYFYYLNKPIGSVFLNVIPPMPRDIALPFQELTIRRKIVDSLLNLPPTKRWKESSLDKTALLLTPSVFMLDQAKRVGLVEQRKSAVVALGVNHSQFHPTTEEEPFALYLGRIHPHKSLELAVLSMKDAPPDYSLIVAGDIEEQYLWYLDRLVGLAQEIGISDRFTVVLHPSDSDVIRLMQKCCLFLFPSTIDSFGLVVLEAMACGKPIVACNRGGVPDIVADSGLLLEPNVEQWRTAVRKMLSDSSFRRHMGQRAQRRSEAFSWENTTRQLIRAFTQLLD